MSSNQPYTIDTTPQGGNIVASGVNGKHLGTDSKLVLETLDQKTKVLSDDYVELQLRIYRLTLFLSALAVLITAFFFGKQASFSLMIGSLSGILYLRLLARGIGKLGSHSRMVSKVQLLVPVLLVLAVSKLPQLDLLPSLIGFLLYKPSLVIQFLLEPWAKD